MHFTTIASTLLTGASLAAALPAADSTLNPRACSIAYPTTLMQLIQDEPTHNTGNHAYVYTSQAANKEHQWATEVQFTGIPAGAYGCQLELFFPAGYRGLEGGARLDFFSLDRDVSVADTWASAPGKVSLVGTQLPALAAQGDTRLVVANGVCSPTMNYRVEVEGQDAGFIGFFQTETAGLRLTYNC
ncbi:hypothetical protein SLS56_008166 [Neofusicoccum ribis]|uniref:Ubiquitin 3 binding protein But2 C-terminal domain-containing protein n=1 Tax=Neofusicoccum ribis TaxID=45134 RepID=A0ABR3SLM5_9PEZI